MTDEHYMKLALQEAQKAYDAGEVPIGAIVVINNKIISRAHNQTELLHDCTAHAEMIALTAAFSELGSKYLTDATLYVTLEPCLMCSGALYWSKIGRIVYGAEDEKNGYSKYFSGNAATASPFHPKTNIQFGMLQDESLSLLKNFFSEKRH